jgi:hypothetical protein
MWSDNILNIFASQGFSCVFLLFIFARPAKQTIPIPLTDQTPNLLTFNNLNVALHSTPPAGQDKVRTIGAVFAESGLSITEKRAFVKKNQAGDKNFSAGPTVHRTEPPAFHLPYSARRIMTALRLSCSF